MTEPLKKPCPACAGRGIVPRERRRMADGRLDPFDLREEELCPSCGGAGAVVDRPRPAETPRPSYYGF